MFLITSDGLRNKMFRVQILDSHGLKVHEYYLIYRAESSPYEEWQGVVHGDDVQVRTRAESHRNQVTSQHPCCLLWCTLAREPFVLWFCEILAIKCNIVEQQNPFCISVGAGGAFLGGRQLH